mgnify:CR=1 FL=1
MIGGAGGMDVDIDTDETVYGLECVPDGTAWALSWDGVVFYGEGAAWERVINLPTEQPPGFRRPKVGR